MKIFVISKLLNNEDGYNYGVAFSNEDKKFFNVFSSILGKISDKRYDFNFGTWLVREETKDYLLSEEKKIVGEDKKLPKPVKKIPDITEGLKLQPYPYQKEVIRFCVAQEKTLIVLPCGSGKSLIGIGTYNLALKLGKISGPCMIVVKASLKQQWAKEVEKFSSFKPCIIQTMSQLKKDKTAFTSQFNGADIFIVNYEQLRDLDIRTKLKQKNFEFVFLDEAQMIKDDTTKRAKAACEFSGAKFTIGATATPVQKNPMDIFGIFKFVNPALFPKKGAFGERYVKWITFGDYIRKPIGAKNQEELNEKLLPWMIVKTKQEISSQLPSLVILQRTTRFTPKQQKKSDQLLQLLKETKEAERKIAANLAKAGAKTSAELKKAEADIMMYQTFAQEIADDELLLAASDNNLSKMFVTSDKSQKTEMLVELVKEIISSGEKVAVFSRFKRYQPILISRFKQEKELSDIKIAVVNGSMSDKQRYQEIYEKFEEGDCQILLMTEAAAEGVNLSHCGYLVELDLAQSYAVQTQRHGRIERADSVHRTVYVYQLLVEDSYDDIALKIVSKKEKLDQTIIKGEAVEEDFC